MTNEERMLAFRQMTQEEKNEMLFEAVTDLQKIANAYAAALFDQTPANMIKCIHCVRDNFPSGIQNFRCINFYIHIILLLSAHSIAKRE